MGVPITVMAEEKILGGTADGDGLRATIVTDLRSEMLTRKEVGGVDMLVTEQAELGSVSSTVENRNLLTAKITGNTTTTTAAIVITPRSGTGTRHYSLFEYSIIGLKL